MKRCLFIPFVLLFFFLGCTTTPIVRNYKWEYDPEKHTKDDIKNLYILFKGNWWNYYGRGMAFMEGGYRKEAINDFEKAIEKLSRDQRSARTYGLNRTDYFANRELGIAYYETSKYEDAMKRLKLSLKSVESPRARFYLREVLKEIGNRKPPEIEILSHNDKDVVDNDFIRLKVRITTENNYIDSVWLNKKKLFIDLNKTEFLFEKTVWLDEKNRIGDKKYEVRIDATNLTGDKYNEKITVQLESQNQPQKSQNGLNNLDYYKQNGILLASAVNDKLMIKHLLSVINNNKTLKHFVSVNQIHKGYHCVRPIKEDDVLSAEDRYKIVLLPFISEGPRIEINSNAYFDVLLHEEMLNFFRIDDEPRLQYIKYHKESYNNLIKKHKVTNFNIYEEGVEPRKKVIDSVLKKNETKVDGILIGKIGIGREKVLSVRKLQELIKEQESSGNPMFIIDKEGFSKRINKPEIERDSKIQATEFEVVILFFDYEDPSAHIFKTPVGITCITAQIPSRTFLKDLAWQLYKKLKFRYPTCVGKVVDIELRKKGKPGTKYKIDFEEGPEISRRMKIVMFRHGEDCITEAVNAEGKITKLVKDQDTNADAKAKVIKGNDEIKISDYVFIK